MDGHTWHTDRHVCSSVIVLSSVTADHKKLQLSTAHKKLQYFFTIIQYLLAAEAKL